MEPGASAGTRYSTLLKKDLGNAADASADTLYSALFKKGDHNYYSEYSQAIEFKRTARKFGFCKATADRILACLDNTMGSTQMVITKADVEWLRKMDDLLDANAATLSSTFLPFS